MASRRLLGPIGAVVLGICSVGCSSGGGEVPGSPAPARSSPSAAPPGSPSPTEEPTATGGTGRADVRLEPVVEGLGSPVDLVPVSDGTGRLFAVEQTGAIRILTPAGRLRPGPFLDLSDRMAELEAGYDERGLLALAFHPSYAANGRLFVVYSAPPRPGGPEWSESTTTLSEFRVSASDPNAADPASERRLLRVDKADINHAGADLGFGPDGLLYVSLGDGGGRNDVGPGHPEIGHGQDLSTLAGSILRIDVDTGGAGGRPYAIPPDNPFADGRGGARPETFAYGFRNPYRFSFDARGRLFVGDVGQDIYEEVDLVRAGGNYGWRTREGMHCTPFVGEGCPRAGLDDEPFVDPIIEYAHDDVGTAVIGGFVYRGRAIPSLRGAYVFGDWSRSRIFSPRGEATLLAARPPSSGDGLWPPRVPDVEGGIPHFLLGIGQDEAGELYLLTRDALGPAGDSGRIFKVVPVA